MDLSVVLHILSKENILSSVDWQFVPDESTEATVRGQWQLKIWGMPHSMDLFICSEALNITDVSEGTILCQVSWSPRSPTISFLNRYRQITCKINQQKETSLMEEVGRGDGLLSSQTEEKDETSFFKLYVYHDEKTT